MKMPLAPKRPRNGRIPQRGAIRRRLLLVLGAVALGVGAYALGGFYGVPWLVDRRLAQYRAAAPDGTALEGVVRFNPFTLVAEIAAPEARDAEARTAFAADRLVIDLAAHSLAELRPVVRSIIVERPQVALASVADLTAVVRRARSTALSEARVDRLELRDGAFTAGVGTDQPLELTRFELSLTGFDGRSTAAGHFSLNAASGPEASIAVDGSLAADLERADGQLRLGAIGLDALRVPLDGAIGAVEPRGQVAVSAQFSATSLLSTPRLELTTASVELSDLALTPAAGLTVTADRAAAVASLVLAAADDGIAVSGRLEIDDARLSIRDARVMPPQSFVFDHAAVLTTAEPETDGFSLSLGGRLSGAGDAALTVRVPPGATAGHRVSLEAADLPATMLSAYSVDVLGRRLTAGNVALSLEYSRNADRLDGLLRLIGRELIFGASPGYPASNDRGPPLELAAALLEDVDGIIEIDLPFASTAGTVRDAVAATLEARLASVTETPFDTLAMFVDGAAETADAVPFLPGDAALNDRAVASIAGLADVLKARPRLGIRLHGGYDPIVDRDALARRQIELHVQLATAGPGAQARLAPLNFASDRVRDVLDEFAGERLSAERVAELAERFDCEGALVPVCERAYYERIFDLLVANEEITPTALSRLGRFRARSVGDALRQQGIEDERIELVTGGETVDTPFGVGLPVELTAADPGA